MKNVIRTGVARRYASVAKEKAEGATYTPKVLADFVAEQIVAEPAKENRGYPLRVLDPAVGDGELLVSLLKKLNAKGYEKIDVFGFDTNEKVINLTSARLRKAFTGTNIHIKLADFLEFSGNYSEAGGNLNLFQPPPSEGFDMIIANPPYVRTQIMGAKQAQLLATRFGLSGRIDLYYAFILGMGRVLKPGGIAGIIVSNRFMTTKSGALVRRSIQELFDIRHVWDRWKGRFVQ